MMPDFNLSVGWRTPGYFPTLGRWMFSFSCGRGQFEEDQLADEIRAGHAELNLAGFYVALHTIGFAP